MTYLVRRLSLTAVGDYSRELQSLYQRAFSASPYNKTYSEIEDFVQFLPIHTAQTGFRIVIEQASVPGPVVGFAYGRSIVEGLPWLDVVRPPLVSEGLDFWLIDSFQLVEMAVDPQYQRRGVGGRLHDHLLEEIPHRRAVLSTLAEESAAYRLYKRKGWTDLLDGILVPGAPREYRLLGLDRAGESRSQN